MSKLPIFQSESAPNQPTADDEFLNQEHVISTPEFLQALLEDKREEVAKMIVQDDRLVKSRDISGASAVQLTVYHGLEHMLGILLRSEVELTLVESAAAGQVDRVRELIDERPESIDEPGGDGFTPLVLAATYGHLDAAAVLLEAGASAGLPANNPTRTTPLHGAAGLKDGEAALKMVDLLLETDGLDLDAEQAGGFTALHRSAGLGHAKVVKRLLDAGADPSIESDLGIKAHDLAKDRGHIAVMALLS